MAAAGLLRLDWAHRITQYLSIDQSLPAVGQGAIGIECREKDGDTQQLLAPLHHLLTAQRVLSERAMNHQLQGGCQVPIAGHAIIEKNNMLFLQGLVGDVDGKKIIRDEIRGRIEEAEVLGMQLAKKLLRSGANDILKVLYNHE